VPTLDVIERLDENAINIYTDGSSKQKPRRGGYAFIYVTVDADGEEVVDERSPDGSLGSNNQEMELKAVVEALKLLSTVGSPVALRDSTRSSSSPIRPMSTRTSRPRSLNGRGDSGTDGAERQC
jgi:RNase H